MLCRKVLIWYRWIRFKAHVWLVLISLLHRYLHAGDIDRTQVEFKLLFALGRINFVVIYDILDDLMRFPPY
jgi:hypothetical protein